MPCLIVGLCAQVESEISSVKLSFVSKSTWDFLPTRTHFDPNDISLETKLMLCSLTKLQTSGVESNETLLVPDSNDPIDTSSPTAIKLDPVVPKDMLSQSTSQLISVSMIA